MELLIIKDQTYEQYKRDLARHAGESRLHAGHTHGSKKHRPHLHRLLLSGIHWASLSAAAFIGFQIIFQEVGLSSALSAPAAHPALRPAAAGVQEAPRPAVRDNPLWRCAGGIYTNTPNSPEACEFVAGSVEGSAAGTRFITPSRPGE